MHAQPADKEQEEKELKSLLKFRVLYKQGSNGKF